MSPRRQKPRSLLIRDVQALVTMDARGRVLRGGYLYAEDGVINAVGTSVPKGLKADRTIRAPFAVALPGLVNTHHHLFQTLTRAHPGAADAALFDWLRALYPVWARLDEEAVHIAAQVGLAELMLSGCTTTADHHYVFPRGQTRLIDAEIEAARGIGIRFHATRGSMSVSEKQGGLPPDDVVEEEDEILADSARLIQTYHDPGPGSMLRVALAPCSPFSVSERLLRETAELATRHAVRLHTHLAETRDEEAHCLRQFGRRPVEFLADAGWMGDGVWVAHGVHLNLSEIRTLGHARVGIAHCPTSNMRLGSYVRAIESSEEISGVFNIASGNYTVGESADIVKDSIERHHDKKVRLLIKHLDDFRNYKVTVEKAINMLSFKPQHTIASIVDDLDRNLDRFKDFDNPAYYNIRVFEALEKGEKK